MADRHERQDAPRRAAVLGKPIAHTLSPVLHRAAYRAMGLTNWSYDSYECDESGLAGFLDGLDDGWAGLSLTMPLKRIALKLADECGDLALAVGGANTLLLRDGRWIAENTDVHGMVTALREAGLNGRSAGGVGERPPRGSDAGGVGGSPRTGPAAGGPGTAGPALVLGGGATAASALVALRELGLTGATLAVRDRTRAGEAADAGERAGLAIEIRALSDLPALLAGFAPHGLVVSTLPAGAADPYAGLLARCGAAVFDVVYAPWPTTLAAAVLRAGGTVVGGLPMLVHQAAGQLRLMTGRVDVPVEVIRAAGEAELAERARRRAP